MRLLGFLLIAACGGVGAGVGPDCHLGTQRFRATQIYKDGAGCDSMSLQFDVTLTSSMPANVPASWSILEDGVSHRAVETIGAASGCGKMYVTWFPPVIPINYHRYILSEVEGSQLQIGTIGGCGAGYRLDPR